jgi:signal transduction histidine kinase
MDVNDVVHDVLPLVNTELRHQEIALTLDLASELAPVVGDRIQLQQVILNLLMNAIEAMESVVDRPREMVIRSRPHDGDQVLVSIQDTGVGIGAYQVDELFSAFFTTKPDGVGMGLSIARSIIEAHGAGSGPRRTPLMARYCGSRFPPPGPSRASPPRPHLQTGQ